MTFTEETIKEMKKIVDITHNEKVRSRLEGIKTKDDIKKAVYHNYAIIVEKALYRQHPYFFEYGLFQPTNTLKILRKEKQLFKKKWLQIMHTD